MNKQKPLNFQSFTPQDHCQFIQNYVQKGGPEPSEWHIYKTWMDAFAHQLQTGKLSKAEANIIRAAFGDAFSLDTLQGFCYHKPHGYAGDFEIIDRLYTGYLTTQPHLSKWDVYFQAQAAPKAVRNRKAYFKKWLIQQCHKFSKICTLLNIGSGPCRDLAELFTENPDINLTVHAVDIDKKAIAYAQNLLQDHADKVQFFQSNIFKFAAPQSYDFIWSAGLFDYLTDRQFQYLLTRLWKQLQTGSEIVIGNFAPHHDTLSYMVLCEWHLNYRSRKQLLALAQVCGIPTQNCRVEMEVEGVNLFLHVRK